MISGKEMIKQIFKISSLREFNDLALEIFHYQYKNNIVYRQFVNSLNTDVQHIDNYMHIPFLPVSFFKNHRIISKNLQSRKIFSSSGTTGNRASHHYVYDLSLYEESFTNGFEYFYGEIKKYCILALLPSYLERKGSSLVYMMDHLIKKTNNRYSGFYLHNYSELSDRLKRFEEKNSKIFLFGATFALLDMVEKYEIDLPDAIIMETGGMKGRRKEMIREELHDQLCRGFGVNKIHSEYGMTELLSQSYSGGSGIFYCPPWMKVLIRDINDPLSLIGHNSTGGINIIDLANIFSCSFIATEDLGRSATNGSFEVLGRFDTSDIRGCSLLVV